MQRDKLSALFDKMTCPEWFDRRESAISWTKADVGLAEAKLGMPLDRELVEAVTSGLVPSIFFCLGGIELSFMAASHACDMAHQEDLIAAGLWPFLCDDSGEEVWHVKHGAATLEHSGQTYSFSPGAIVYQSQVDDILLPVSSSLDEFFEACASVDVFRSRIADGADVEELYAELAPRSPGFVEFLKVTGRPSWEE